MLALREKETIEKVFWRLKIANSMLINEIEKKWKRRMTRKYRQHSASLSRNNECLCLLWLNYKIFFRPSDALLSCFSSCLEGNFFATCSLMPTFAMNLKRNFTTFKDILPTSE